MSSIESESSRVTASPVQKGLCSVFVSYSHVDEVERERLCAHLAPLEREGRIELWCSRKIAPGADWASRIENELTRADIVILLVTADFIASEYCIQKELAIALSQEDTRILPVLVKPVDFSGQPFAKFQALPRDLRPINTRSNPDEAWEEVARGVRNLVDEFHLAGLPTQRKAPDKSRLGRELAEYYGTNNCVVDGSDGTIEWVPLNEDVENMCFDNLVPISSRHRLRSLRYLPGTLQRPTFRFGIDLNAERLFHRARRHFYEGRPALAFGCARLGEVLAVNYPYHFEAHEGDDWAFLAQSLFYLPYRTHPALLDATLRRLRDRLATNPDYSTIARAALLLAVANLYQDAGAWANAERLYDEILRNSPTQHLAIAAFRRRAVGRLFGRTNDHDMDRDLRSMFEYRTNADLSVSLAMSQAWWHLANGRFEQCLSRLEGFDLNETYSPPRAIELKLTQASALAALGFSYEPHLRFVREREHQTHLRPVFTDHIAPALLAGDLDEVIKPLRSTDTPQAAALGPTAEALLTTKGTTVPARPVWVD